MQSMVFWEPFTSGSSVAVSGHDYLIDRIYGAMGWLSGSQYYLTDASSTLVPAHRLVTTYHYNSLNQVLQQYSPDGDTSRFYYDRLGRLFASQNMKQLREDSYDAGEGRYSYTRYDSLGRIAEVGEKSGDVTDIAEVNVLDQEEVNDWLASGSDKQVTKTLYDNPVNINEQDYGTSRKRVVASIYLDAAGDSEGDSSLYVYDIIGNVKTLLQHNKRLVAVDNANGRKRIDYDYDLVSGKVNMVSYQHGKGDQFYYKYSYDAENRLTRSLSSRDKLIWTEDASYSYYLHGPLAKTELGQLKVQGVDYMYTLQGWLKGINGNALSPQYEMGQDGYSGTTFGRVSRDVYSYGLGYFADDYRPIGTGAHAMNQAAYVHPDNTANTGRQLFNGNISNTVVALSKIESGEAKGYSYGYDQLNRLVYMNQHTVSGSTWSNSNIISAYAESIAYDANGNILKYLRNGANVSGMPLQMDSLSYKYNRDISGHLVNNKLRQVKDAVSASNYSVDIDDQSDADNYSYDRIGNLKKDIAEGIDTIRWTVYGKINKVVKAGASTVIDYSYDPGGNRTTKNVTVSGNTTTTFYVRDAQGNVMGVYEKKNTDDLTWEEQHLYGSSRLGMWRNDTIVPASPPVVQGTTPLYDSLLLGSRTYELSNHLGNVLATISDKKIGNDSSGVVNYYIAEVLSQEDYYPGGMELPGRSYTSGNGYRYSINGQEKTPEIAPNTTTAEYWQYDARIVRRWNVDPVDQISISNYSVFANNPLWIVDPLGNKVDTLNVTDQAGNFLMKLDDGKKEVKTVTAKELYAMKVQWFEPNGDNYMKPISTNANIGKMSGIKHFTSDQLIDFAESHPIPLTYCEGCPGDWKKSKDGGSGYLLSTVNDKLYWTDGVGNMVFGYAMFKDELRRSIALRNRYDDRTLEVKARSITLTKEWNITGALDAVKKYGNGNPFSPTSDYSRSYDNLMGLRGILFAAERLSAKVGKTEIEMNTNWNVSSQILSNSINAQEVKKRF